MTINILTVIGARPQFVKASVISKAIREFTPQRGQPSITETVLHTGQHYDQNMSEVFFQEMGVSTPKYNLHTGGLSHGAMTGRMLEEIEKILIKEKPNWVLVYGDTNTTLAASLASVKCHIPLIHIEAGLRSFNREEPEEINRILTDQCATLLFTPTDSGKKQLLQEGIPSDKIIRVGDVMYDATQHHLSQALKSSHILKKHNIPKKFLLATVHRESNTHHIDRLKKIIQALASLSKETPIVLPLHPRTRRVAEQNGLLKEIEHACIVIPPIGYFDMLVLESHAEMILTDSGGVQKEAYFVKKPCLTMRDETEWVELVEQGYNILTGANTQKIVQGYHTFSKTNISWKEGLYGDGKAGEKIVNTIHQRGINR